MPRVRVRRVRTREDKIVGEVTRVVTDEQSVSPGRLVDWPLHHIFETPLGINRFSTILTHTTHDPHRVSPSKSIVRVDGQLPICSSRASVCGRLYALRPSWSPRPSHDDRVNRLEEQIAKRRSHAKPKE